VKRKINYRWIVKIVLWTIALTTLFTLISSSVLSNAGFALAFSVLALFILLGIVFDIVGVAVTSAEEKPFHSMASHKEPGAVEAIRLLKNAEKVSSFCNDVVGDIAGIVSGTTSVVIVERLMQAFRTERVVISLIISGLVAGLTIGGKAIGKTFAVKGSVPIVLFVAKLIHAKNKLVRKLKKEK